ncbi:MAG: isocitrate lyase/PEP mutase family protein [Pseudomonadota bacterium]
MTDRAQQRRQLKERLMAREAIMAPGVFDMISAKIADQEGFDALYMTGYGISASYLGLPDAGLASYADMVNCVQRIANGCKTPLIADGDTGYGGALNVRHTVAGYEAAGAAAIQLEDQKFPKKCGHTLGRDVIDLDDMLLKIRVALDTRTDPNFLIIARTDARTAHGLEAALERGKAFRDAGADVVFVESPESEEEMRLIIETLDCPLVANMVEGGFTPVFDQEKLKEMGFALSIFPATGFLTVGAALGNAYRTLRAEGGSESLRNQMDDFDKFSRMIGFADVWEFEKRYGT